MRLLTLSTITLLTLVAMPAYGMADPVEPAASTRLWRTTLDTSAERATDAWAVRFAFHATPLVTGCASAEAPTAAMRLGAMVNRSTTAARGKWCDDQCFRCAVGFIIGRPDPLACYRCFQVCPFGDPLEPPEPIEVGGKREEA